MGLPEYWPTPDDDAQIFADAMQPKHQSSSDPAVRRHNADRRHERQHLADGSEDSIFKFALKD